MSNKEIKNFHESIVNFYNDFDDVFSLIYYYDANNNVIDRIVSPSITKLSGYSQKEFMTIDLSTLYVNISDRHHLLNTLKKEGSIRNKIHPFLKKSGELIFISFSAELITNNLPKDCEFALKAILRDVTEYQHEKIRLKIAQHISQKSHKRIVDLNKLGTIIHEELRSIIYFSNFYIATIDAKKGKTIFFKDDVSSKEIKTTYFERNILKNGFTEHLIKSSKIIVKEGKSVEECVKKYKINMKGALPAYLVSIPIKNEGKSVGVIVFQVYNKNIAFSKDDVEFFKLIANQVSDVISRKYFQEQIIQNEQYFRTLIENSSEIIGILNKRGVLEYISNSVAKNTGFHSHELIGKNIIKLIDKEKLFNQTFKKSKLDDTPIVVKIINKAGEKRYLEVALSFLNDQEFSKRLLFNARDITKRIIAERKKDFAFSRLEILHQIERSLISNQPISNVLYNTLTIITERILKVDRASISVLNYEKKNSEIIALKTPYKKNIKIKEGDTIPFDELTSFPNTIKGKTTIKNDLSKLKKITESDRNNIAEGIKSYMIKPIVINNKVVGTFNFGSKNKNFFSSLDNDLMDEITLLVSVVLNELIIKNELFGLRNALNNTVSLFYTDKEGIIISVNQKFIKSTGFSEKELIGSNVNILNSNYHIAEEWKTFWNKIKSGKIAQQEIRNKRKDGTFFWVFQTVTPIFDNKGDIEKFIAIQFDITESKEQKNKLIKEVIEAQEKERERFAMEIHDGLGQLLLAAKMNMNALKYQIPKLDEECIDICNITYNLINDAIIEARSISHGLMSRVLSNYGLAYAVNDMINNINSSNAISFKFNQNIYDKRFDEELEMGIYRTLQELINNIIKHSKANQAYLLIWEEANELAIKLSDNGIGINKEVLNNPKKGGIGLRNMKSRIEFLGGRLTINDSVKIGTEININIKLN